MGDFYATARRHFPNSSQLLMDQRGWMARRNACRDASCISNEYQARLAQLSGSPVAQRFPIAPAAPTSSGAVTPPGAEDVGLISEGGVLTVPVRINDVITINFVLDSGALDVTIPADVVKTLERIGAVTPDDFLGGATVTYADGSRGHSRIFRIRSLKVGNRILEDVKASETPIEGELLLGQSFLSRFRSWSINNQRRVLVLE